MLHPQPSKRACGGNTMCVQCVFNNHGTLACNCEPQINGELRSNIHLCSGTLSRASGWPLKNVTQTIYFFIYWIVELTSPLRKLAVPVFMLSFRPAANNLSRHISPVETECDTIFLEARNYVRIKNVQEFFWP